MPEPLDGAAAVADVARAATGCCSALLLVAAVVAAVVGVRATDTGEHDAGAAVRRRRALRPRAERRGAAAGRARDRPGAGLRRHARGERRRDPGRGAAPRARSRTRCSSPRARARWSSSSWPARTARSPSCGRPPTAAAPPNDQTLHLVLRSDVSRARASRRASASGGAAEQRAEGGLVEHGHALLVGLVELGAGLGAGDQRARLGRHAAAHLGAERLQLLLHLVAGEAPRACR